MYIYIDIPWGGIISISVCFFCNITRILNHARVVNRISLEPLFGADGFP